MYEVDVTTEDSRDRDFVRRESIRCQLVVTIGCSLQLLGEGESVVGRSLPEMPRDDKFAGSLDGDKRVGVTVDVPEVFRDSCLFLAADETPNLVGLNVVDAHVDEPRFHHSLAVVANMKQQREDRILVNAGQTHRRSRGRPFDKVMNDGHGLIHWQYPVARSF